MTRARALISLAIILFRNRYLSFVFRIVAGGTLVFSGITKIMAGSAFVEEVAEYEMLPEVLIDVFAAILPWVEVFVGAFLILGLFARIASGIGALTVLSFLIANSVVLYRGLTMDCPCFGEMAAVPTEVALIMDCALFIMTIQILLRKGDFLSLGSLIFHKRLNTQNPKSKVS